MSLPEVLMWQRLRGSPQGMRFRRQHPVGPYVIDFFCRTASLVIEIDGMVHDTGDRPARDTVRDRYFAASGLSVLRVPAADVLRDPDAVAASIVAYAATPLHHQPAAGGPPPRSGEDLMVANGTRD